MLEEWVYVSYMCEPWVSLYIIYVSYEYLYETYIWDMNLSMDHILTMRLYVYIY